MRLVWNITFAISGSRINWLLLNSSPMSRGPAQPASKHEDEYGCHDGWLVFLSSGKFQFVFTLVECSLSPST